MKIKNLLESRTRSALLTEDQYEFLEENEIEKFHINKDGSIDVEQDVTIHSKEKEFPIVFNVIYGNFDCAAIGLKTLKNSPRKITGDFSCEDNKLKTLEFGPEEVEGFYVVSNNMLESLKGAPIKVKDFDCSFNKKLLTFKDGPTDVANSIFASGCGLTSFKYIPRNVTELDVTNSPIETLKDLPETLSDLDIDGTNIKSLKDIHKKLKGPINWIGFDSNVVDSILGIIMLNPKNIYIRNLYNSTDSDKIEKILNNHLGKGRTGVLAAQKELIEAGYEEHAQL